MRGAPPRAADRAPSCPAATLLGVPAASRAPTAARRWSVSSRARLRRPALDLGLARIAPGTLPRKEVIQPQLPLRLPCYDFVPVTNPTLDGSAPCGFGHRLQVLPAPMT
jgi:hypothetical protein